MNDGDIEVPPNYLREVVATLAIANTGLATCLYRAAADSWPARAEALGIATEFAPSVLVARLLGVAEFALGSTMAFRAAALQQIGGFEAIAPYLADDYQLGCHISRLGYRIRLAPFYRARPTWARQPGRRCGVIKSVGRAPSAFRAHRDITVTRSLMPPSGRWSPWPRAHGGRRRRPLDCA